ncbi:MAG: acetate--CoA ligase family protein [Candidatus Rokubacteria bacterium]|nr:acetate--CoA ligase family protein [Candidatus Rokubacteria bacterium]
MSDLEALFSPRSVAVLGVSRNPAKLGFRLLQNLKERGFPGAIHPVNPSGESILGLVTVPAVEALPEGIDLALVSLPAPAVPDAIRALAARHARAAVILSSGFGEVDEEGSRVQADLLGAARAAGLRLVGPNCMGVYSAPADLNGTYFWDLPAVRGGVSIVSQSGAYGGLIFRHLGSRGLGVSRFLSVGNQADVDLAEVLDYLADDPETTLVACFVEALRDGRAFLAAAARATARKPVVVLKGGRSDAGRRAAGSHTGALAGAYETYRAAFRRANVVLAEETEEFFDAIETLVLAGDRRPAAPSLAVITVSGGPSVVAADAAERAGLAVPALDEGTRAALRALLPPFAAVGNPVDLTPQVDPGRIAAAVGLVLDQPAVAGAVAVNVGLDIAEFADGIVGAAKATGKLVVAFVADAPEVAARLRAGAVPVLPSPERAVRAWRALWNARPRPSGVGGTGGTPRASLPVGERTGVGGTSGASVVPSEDVPPARVLTLELRRALDETRGALPYALARGLLEAYGVRFCREAVAATPEEAARAAEAIGFPVVVKADAEGLSHKTEAGAVRTGLDDAAAVSTACRAIARAVPRARFVVQAEVGPGVEILVGGRRDEVFGPVVVAGVGGILTEVIRDVSLRLAPVDEEEADEMLREGPRARLLGGPRGLPRLEDDSLRRAVVGIGDLLLAEPRILEVDHNPVIVAAGTSYAVDALVVVGEPGA